MLTYVYIYIYFCFLQPAEANRKVHVPGNLERAAGSCAGAQRRSRRAPGQT